MTESEILAEVKKGIDLFLDKTYEMQDLYGHLLQIIKDNSKTGENHKEQLERLIFRVEQLRESQRLYWAGHKSKLGECKAQESELDKKLMYLQTHAPYTIERFKKEKPTQTGLF
jgi:hypothetical protein